MNRRAQGQSRTFDGHFRPQVEKTLYKHEDLLLLASRLYGPCEGRRAIVYLIDILAVHDKRTYGFD